VGWCTISRMEVGPGVVEGGEASPLARRWRRAVPALIDVSLRAAYMRSELVTAPLDAVALALDELGTEAERGRPAARDLMAAALPALADGALGGWRQRLRQIASERNLPVLSSLLGPSSFDASPLPLGGKDEGCLAATPQGRPLTLGERRALARRPSRVALDVLMRDQHPMVVRALLDTPRLTEDNVVRMAARRPGRPEALVEIARHPRWILRPRVRLALVCNPSTPPAVALPLVALLLQPELEQLALATDVLPALRRAARSAAAERAR
jgi:hypothetical protein